MNGSHLFLINLLSTWYMVGLIWMVQVVHYNLFDRVGSEAFAHYEAEHNRLITPIVGIPMLAEIGTAVALLLAAPGYFPRWAAWLGLGLVILIWISTAVLQVPCHQRLMNGFDEATYHRLVVSNWIRTLGWSARGVLLAWFAGPALR